jgi:transcription factor SFP1
MCSACDFVIHEAVDLGLSIEEAEERNRPYVCAVGAGCKKRYRQMNGLKVCWLSSNQ